MLSNGPTSTASRGRAESDAILVGATTVRHDDPRLLVRDARLRQRRVERGLAADPAKVTVTTSGRLDAGSRFFTTGETEKLVYCASPPCPRRTPPRCGSATVVDGGDPVGLARLLEDLHARGIQRLMVEGGGQVHTQFLTQGLADELHLVIAPVFVGTSRGRRFVGDGTFPWDADHRARVAETRQIEDVVLVRYALSDRCDVQTQEERHVVA